jgi:Protein of unknown function (DUF1566)
MNAVMQRTQTRILAAHCRSHFTVIVLVGMAMLIGAGTAQAANSTQKCHLGRYKAAALYIACQQKLMAVFFAKVPTPPDADQAAVSKCRGKNTAAWSRVQAKASGTESICDHARFQDNDDGTVTDRLTELQWEKKTSDATVHDVDNLYSWSAGGDGFAAADGTALTGLLATLNSGSCFAGQCDWRLPTIYELQTILLEAYPCTTSPCIDQTIFGPTTADQYWSATTLTTDPTAAWNIFFDSGSVGYSHTGSSYYVRAVRGGL